MAALPQQPTEATVYAMVLGRVVQRLREQRHITQVDLAQQVGLTQSHLSRVERGEAQPSAYVVSRLAGAFSMGVEDLDRLVREAQARAAKAAQAAAPGQVSREWWEGAIAVAGLVGLAGLVLFAVAAVAEEKPKRGARSPRRPASR